MERFRQLPASAPVPHRYVEQAISLAADFAADPATDGRLIHTDLHYENMLAGDREPWLVIDPKPLSGDPRYEVAAADLEPLGRGHCLRRPPLPRPQRFYTAIDAAGLDEERARNWVIVRQMLNVLWTLEGRQRPTRPCPRTG